MPSGNLITMITRIKTLEMLYFTGIQTLEMLFLTESEPWECYIIPQSKPWESYILLESKPWGCYILKVHMFIIIFVHKLWHVAILYIYVARQLCRKS